MLSNDRLTNKKKTVMNYESIKQRGKVLFLVRVQNGKIEFCVCGMDLMRLPLVMIDILNCQTTFITLHLFSLYLFNDHTHLYVSSCR